MNLSEKLKSLRAERGITQETAAEYLGVSAQTVSKWERGLLSPDIRLLPKLAVLYEVSLDALFDMDTLRGDIRREAFTADVDRMRHAGDYEGMYRMLLSQIELTPDDFTDYPTLMQLVRRCFAGDEARIRRMINLAAYADRHCREDHIRNEIHLHMAHICHASSDPTVRKRAIPYLEKLPLIRHNRETQMPVFLEGDARETQIKWNILSAVDRAECAIRLLVREDTPVEEKLTLYRVAVSLYDAILGDGYGGFWDVPRLSDWVEIAALCTMIGHPDEAQVAMERVFSILREHCLPWDARHISPLTADTHPDGYAPPEMLVKQLVQAILDKPILSPYHAEAGDLYRHMYSQE